MLHPVAFPLTVTVQAADRASLTLTPLARAFVGARTLPPLASLLPIAASTMDVANLLASPMDVANLIDAKAIDAAVAVDDVAMAAAILDEIALLTAPSVVGKGCPHLYKHKASCRFCTPRNFCIHDKRKYICVACGGGAICPHGRRKTTCRFCREAKASA